MAQDQISVSNRNEWVRICRSRGARVVGDRAFKGESLVGKWESTTGVYQAKGGLEPTSAKVVRRALQKAERAIREAYKSLQEDITPYDKADTTNGRVDDGVAAFVNQANSDLTYGREKSAYTKSDFGPGFKGRDNGPYPSDKGDVRSNTPGQTKEARARRAARSARR